LLLANPKALQAVYEGASRLTLACGDAGWSGKQNSYYALNRPTNQQLGLIYDAHAPAADLGEYAVMGNRLPHGLGGRSHSVDMLGGDKGKVNQTGG